jgi:hypothetical protein
MNTLVCLDEKVAYCNSKTSEEIGVENNETTQPIEH